MKIGLVTDTHFGFKKANKEFHNYFSKFYSDVFFPVLEENNIKTVIHLGDSFDNRKGVDYWAFEWAKKNVYDKFKELGITVYSIVGNHDAYYKNNNTINSLDCLLQEYDNIIKISNSTEYIIDNLKILFVPWICKDNEKQSLSILKKSKAKVVFGHLELGGFTVYPGHVHTEGMNKEIFNKFDRVFSGHYHTRSGDGKIFYLGNPYQMFWSDVNDKRGFHIFDTENYQLDYYPNPFSMFEKVYYDESIGEFDESYLENKMVKVIVRKKDDIKKFENFVNKIANSNPLELKIIENFDVFDDNVSCEDIPTEDTLSILDKYVEEAEFDLDKNIVKKILREFYKEALEVG